MCVWWTQGKAVVVIKSFRNRQPSGPDMQARRKEASVKQVWGTGWSQIPWSTGLWVSAEGGKMRQVKEVGGAMVKRFRKPG